MMSSRTSNTFQPTTFHVMYPYTSSPQRHGTVTEHYIIFYSLNCSFVSAWTSIYATLTIRLRSLSKAIYRPSVIHILTSADDLIDNCQYSY